MPDASYTLTGEVKIYPKTCVSSSCGNFGSLCRGCVYEKELADFSRWCKEHEAIVIEPIWSPNYYYATK